MTCKVTNLFWIEQEKGTSECIFSLENAARAPHKLTKFCRGPREATTERHKVATI